MQQTHTRKAVTGRVEVKKLLSCRIQSDYSILNQCFNTKQFFFFWGGDRGRREECKVTLGKQNFPLIFKVGALRWLERQKKVVFQFKLGLLQREQ